MSKLPTPEEGLVLTQFIVSDDVEHSRRFYTEVLGGESICAGEPSFAALANSWIIINPGGGPTDDKPTVTLEAPQDPDHVSSFLNIRVAHIHAVYEEWSARGGPVPNPTDRPRSRAPLLHPRPRRAPDRSWPNHSDSALRRQNLSAAFAGTTPGTPSR